MIYVTYLTSKIQTLKWNILHNMWKFIKFISFSQQVNYSTNVMAMNANIEKYKQIINILWFFIIYNIYYSIKILHFNCMKTREIKK